MSAFDDLLAGERRDRMRCDCGAPATARLVVSLREIGPTGSFVKGGKNIQRGSNLCEECGARQWIAARNAAQAGGGVDG